MRFGEVISGRGIVRHAEKCHNEKGEKNMMRIELTQVLEDSYHPINRKRLEAGSYTTIPIRTATLNNC